MMTEERNPYSPYEEWERRMTDAADYLPCERPDASSSSCSCSPCLLAQMWDRLSGLERGILFAGMVKQGFDWPEAAKKEAP